MTSDESQQSAVNAAVAQALGFIGHEIAHPVARLVATASHARVTLARASVDAHEAGFAELGNDLRNSAEQLREQLQEQQIQIETILRISRLTAQTFGARLRLERTQTSATAVINDAWNMATDHKQLPHRATVDIRGADLFVSADRPLLVQAIAGLFIYALEGLLPSPLEKGRNQHQPPMVTVSIKGDDNLRLSISYVGRPISSDKVLHSPTPFLIEPDQDDRYPRRSTPMQFWLPIAKRIAEAHGGSLKLRSIVSRDEDRTRQRAPASNSFTLEIPRARSGY